MSSSEPTSPSVTPPVTANLTTPKAQISSSSTLTFSPIFSTTPLSPSSVSSLPQTTPTSFWTSKTFNYNVDTSFTPTSSSFSFTRKPSKNKRLNLHPRPSSSFPLRLKKSKFLKSTSSVRLASTSISKAAGFHPHSQSQFGDSKNVAYLSPFPYFFPSMSTSSFPSTLPPNSTSTSTSSYSSSSSSMAVPYPTHSFPSSPYHYPNLATGTSFPRFWYSPYAYPYPYPYPFPPTHLHFLPSPSSSSSSSFTSNKFTSSAIAASSNSSNTLSKSTSPTSNSNWDPSTSTQPRSSLLWHFEFPALMMGYIQLLWSLLLVCSFSYFLYLLYWAIQMDLNMKVQEASSSLLQEIAQCTKEYTDNQCDLTTRVPALQSKCSQWEACMQRDPSRIAWTKVSALALAEILDQFVDQLSLKTMAFFVLLFTFFLVLNLGYSSNRKKIADINSPSSSSTLPNPALLPFPPYYTHPSTFLPPPPNTTMMSIPSPSTSSSGATSSNPFSSSSSSSFSTTKFTMSPKLSGYYPTPFDSASKKKD